MVRFAKPGAPRAMGCYCIWPLLLVVTGCAGQHLQATAAGPSPPLDRHASACSQEGVATWYRGASRDRASPQDLVAAHRTLPFGTSVQVTAIETGQSIVVRINDRGPFARGRIIDLSRSAADELGMRRDGVARVRIEPIGSESEACPFQEAWAD